MLYVRIGTRCAAPCFEILSRFCQAQPQLQAKLSLEAELPLTSINPAPNHHHLGKFNL
jgi:hypothetical protein